MKAAKWFLLAVAVFAIILLACGVFLDVYTMTFISGGLLLALFLPND